MDKKDPLKTVHLVLMGIMITWTIAAAIRFIRELNVSPAAFANIILMAVTLIMLIMGVIYLLREYGRPAALYYRLFLILNVAATVMTIFIDNCYYEAHALMICINILNGAKVLLLIYLAIGKNLGSKNTWFLFSLLLAADAIKLVLAVFYMLKVGFGFSLAAYVTALITDSTIGLAIRGKFQDKISRNREI